MHRLITLVVIIAIGIWFVSWISRRRSLFRFRIRKGAIFTTGHVPGRSASEILEFINNLNLPERSEIRGIRDGQFFRLEFNDPVPEHMRQRIRNYLMLRL